MSEIRTASEIIATTREETNQAWRQRVTELLEEHQEVAHERWSQQATEACSECQTLRALLYIPLDQPLRLEIEGKR